MPTADLSLLSTQFGELGAPIFGKQVIDWDIRKFGVQVRTNVKVPQFLVKIAAGSRIRPYRLQSDNGINPKYTNRVLTVNQTKLDWQFDPEDFRNTVLGNAPGTPFYELAVAQTAKEILADIALNSLWSGIYNAAGVDPTAVCDGWGTIIANEITGGGITPAQVISTGAINSSNAVAKIDLIKTGVSQVMKQKGFRIYCSYSVFEAYAANYRTVNGFKFEPKNVNEYPVDNSLAVLTAVPWIPPASLRVVATMENNFVFGTDIEQVQIYATPFKNYLEIRNTIPVGCQIQDLEILYVNDQE